MELDHIVIGAATLDQGAAYVQNRLGVEVPVGGQHTHMGTHNRLMSLGGRTYFEIIALDPTLPSPDRARWFGLDDAATQANLAERPRLIAWVARSTDVVATVAACSTPLGTVSEMRRGDFRWRMALRDDGALSDGGCVPIVIEWPDGLHPADNMADLGCRLQEMQLGHPDPAALRTVLTSMGAEALAVIEQANAPHLSATLTDPSGNPVVFD